MGSLLVYFVLSFIIIGITLAVVFNPSVKDKGAKILAGIVGPTLFGILTVLFTVTTISSGHVGVLTTFGSVSDREISQGINFAMPWQSIHQVSIQRDEIVYEADETGEDSTIAISQDSTPLRITTSFPYSLNPGSIWKVYQNVGIQRMENMLRTAAFTAVRTVTARYPWREAATISRDQFAIDLGDEFKELIRSDLLSYGFEENEAENLLSISSARVRRILPPVRVLDAISEEQGAIVDLDRQEVLTDIAKEEAARRAEEGTGIARMFAELPEGFTSEEIANVLGAVANKTRADAMMRAMEAGNVNTIVLPGIESNASIPVGR